LADSDPLVIKRQRILLFDGRLQQIQAKNPILIDRFENYSENVRELNFAIFGGFSRFQGQK
jgi:hypothetical protein